MNDVTPAHRLLTRRAALLPLVPVLLSAAACGGEDARNVRVELDLQYADCPADPLACTVHLTGSGLVVRSDGTDDLASVEGQSTLYAEVMLPSGALAMIEIAYGPRGASKLRYREVEGGALSFRGRTSAIVVDLPEADGPWYERGEFSFVATGDAGDAAGSRRVITNGRVYPVSPDQVEVRETWVDSDPSAPRSSVRVVVVVHDTGAGDYDTPSSDGCEGDTVDEPAPEPTPDVNRPIPSTPDPYATDEGCDGGSSSDDGCSGGGGSSGSESGCGGDSSDEGSSCEGSSSSSSDSGGCESSSSSSSSDGCDSSSSSSGCEGDAYAGITTSEARPRRGRSPLEGVFRLAWPVGLVALVNRRQRRR